MWFDGFSSFESFQQVSHDEFDFRLQYDSEMQQGPETTASLTPISMVSTSFFTIFFIQD